MNNIFEKINNTNERIILSYNEIIESIPKTATDKSDDKKKLKYTEWRWRFFNLNGRKLIEISKKQPNKARMFVDNNGEWIDEFKADKLDTWCKYLIETKYYYASNE